MTATVMTPNKKIVKIASRIVGLLVFLILLAIANKFLNHISSKILSNTILFFNQNFWLIVGTTAAMLVADVLSMLSFPLNLGYPLFYAIGGYLTVTIIFHIVEILERLFHFTILFLPVKIIILAIVVLLIPLAGYVQIFSKVKREKKSPVVSKRIAHDNKS
jgi:hypothetical protein